MTRIRMLRLRTTRVLVMALAGLVLGTESRAAEPPASWGRESGGKWRSAPTMPAWRDGAQWTDGPLRPARRVTGDATYAGSEYGLGKPSFYGLGSRPDWGRSPQ